MLFPLYKPILKIVTLPTCLFFCINSQTSKFQTLSLEKDSHQLLLTLIAINKKKTYSIKSIFLH